MGRLALQLPTNEPNFTIERFENGYYRISGISLQTIQINLNEMMQTASAAPVTGIALRQPVLTRGRRKVTITAKTPAPVRKKRKLSAAGRQAIAAAQKKRWANRKREEKTMAASG